MSDFLQAIRAIEIANTKTSEKPAAAAMARTPLCGAAFDGSALYGLVS
ncbi:hypothetical protein LOC67_17115 [Stieleria sp. JC731]|nr:hypothetical protein [Stieleria sp. JC731]MCC9602277.1 hypothetical protein [Stieleria sp. JC731]